MIIELGHADERRPFPVNKERIEGLTDAIVAIAATIMVLQLGVPASSGWDAFLSLGSTFFAYVVSFFLIYIIWSMHHDLFQHAEHISRRTFMANGIWLFFLTLVPFTTAWLGKDPFSEAAEFLYPLNLMLWSGAMHWLGREIRLDNPDLQSQSSAFYWERIAMILGFLACMIAAFLVPVLSIIGIAIITVIIFLSFLIRGRRL